MTALENFWMTRFVASASLSPARPPRKDPGTGFPA